MTITLALGRRKNKTLNQSVFTDWHNSVGREPRRAGKRDGPSCVGLTTGGLEEEDTTRVEEGRGRGGTCIYFLRFLKGQR